MERTLPIPKPLLLAAFFLLSSVCFSQVTQQWVTRYNGAANSFDEATAIALDGAGNVYITGSSRLGENNADFATIKYDSKGNQLWLKTYNGTGNGSDGANAIAIDANGNVYVTGQSEGSGSFNFDYVTIKYDTKGNQLWVRRYDGPGIATDIASAIAVDAAGNAYITGSSYGSSFNTDYATIKYGSDGSLKWVSRYDGPGVGNDGANALFLDNNGNVYVTGYSTGGSGTAEDYATIKYNASGAQQWVARYNGPANSFEQAFSVAVDLTGNIYVTGQSFEPGGNGSAYATIKYNTSGVKQWVSRYHPGVGADVAKAVAIDAAGNVYVTGQIAIDNSDFAGDFATIKYNTNGVQQWVAKYNGPDQDIDQAAALVLDAAGNVYVTGLSYYIKSGLSTQSDYTTIKYNTNGVQQWIARYGGPGNSTDISTAIAVDAVGNVYVTGLSYGNGTDFDYATIKYAQLSGCGNKKVTVCHNGKNLCININAVSAHLKHGDQMGACVAPQVTASITNTNDVGQHAEAAGNLRIFHFPDPVSSIAKIQYELPFDGQVTVKVYDMLGRQVATVAGAGRKAGHYITTFDASNLNTGMYYYRVILKTEKQLLIQTEKISVVK